MWSASGQDGYFRRVEERINTEECKSTSLRRGAVVLQAIQTIYRWEIDHANYHMLFGYRPEDRLVLMLLLCLRCHLP